ncbi:hypothetical protein GCM10017581_104770 [Dactylosporangium matsuzakiense]|uniref:AMP-dependent synthetase/ligase domain-containing protein n=1 Tax=Dactylosporangium matsuzakiense TaxID=53360 RepID=A0A9W6KWU0_9ACTN|nr:hypothetical protein GCM10017581_104770 [Dactylosporangium matsuzakiense]
MLDVDWPAARRAAVLAASGAVTVLTAAGLHDLGDEPAPDLDRGGELAYVLFTSGSSGTPKGVMVHHDGLAAILAGWERAYRLGERVTSVLQMAAFGFDVFVGDLARALGTGARLVLCPRPTLAEPGRLLALIERERIDFAEFVPVVARALTAHAEAVGATLGCVAVAVVGSDVVYRHELAALRRLLGPDGVVVNSYGLTEATIDSTWSVVGADEGHDRRALIGRPYPGADIAVLDERGGLTPPGVPGTLHIGGVAVARGYLGAPARTAERFVPDPAGGGARLYDTGDLVRWVATGDGWQLEYLGRRARRGRGRPAHAARRRRRGRARPPGRRRGRARRLSGCIGTGDRRPGRARPRPERAAAPGDAADPVRGPAPPAAVEQRQGRPADPGRAAPRRRRVPRLGPRAAHRRRAAAAVRLA